MVRALDPLMKPGAKRFYKSVEVVPSGAAFAVHLDAKPIKTPAGKSFAAPIRALADAIAEEWRAQGDTIVPETMQLTKTLNTVIDRIAANRAAIVEDLAKYGASDLLCYRAAEPAELVHRQSAAWDPWLAWAREQHGVHLTVATGMTPIAQPAEALARLEAAMGRHDDHRLAALHTAVTITGSAVLGIAFTARAITAEALFETAQVDEIYQVERWGLDAEAEAVRARRLADLKASERYLSLLEEARS